MTNQLTLGKTLPDLTLYDQAGTKTRLLDQIGENPLVIYFYPKDDTPGCTAEACSFRDHYEEFEKFGAKIIGISTDSVESHAAFAKKYHLNFTLLSDPQRIAEKKFGVERNLFGFIPGRVTFVFDKEGTLVYKFSSAVMATKHISEALKALKKLQA